MITLGGTIICKNTLSLDYCFREAIQSLLPVCDQVVVSDGESTDGTWEELQEWARREPKLTLCSYKWPDSHSVNNIIDWENFARERLCTDWNLLLEADEILSEQSYSEIEQFKRDVNHSDRKALLCHRWNFWGGPKTVIPSGVCLADKVLRVAPSKVWIPSDFQHPCGKDAEAMATQSGIQIFHYGFLRKAPAYFEKSRVLHTFLFGAFSDKRLMDVEHAPGNWMLNIRDVEYINRLVPFTGEHPELAKPWLLERGWNHV